MIERKGTSLEDIERMVKEIYMKMGKKAPTVRKQFLILQLILFMGLKRFSDVNRIRIKDIEFKEDGSMEIFMNSSKTDQLKRGEKFEISGEKMKNGILVPEIVKWYLKDLKLEETAYVFFKLTSKGKI